MPGQQGVQHVGGIAKARILQTFDCLVRPDETTTRSEVENTECSGDSEASVAGNFNAATIINEQELGPDANRKQDGGTLAVVQAKKI